MNRGRPAGRCFVVGGHSRSVGKMALAVALVRAVLMPPSGARHEERPR